MDYVGGGGGMKKLYSVKLYNVNIYTEIQKPKIQE